VAKAPVLTDPVGLRTFGFPEGVTLSRFTLDGGPSLIVTSSLRKARGAYGKLRVALAEDTGEVFVLKVKYSGPRREGVSRRGVSFIAPTEPRRVPFEANLARRFGLAGRFAPFYATKQRWIKNEQATLTTSFTSLRRMDGSVHALSKWVERHTPPQQLAFARQALARLTARRLFFALADMHIESPDLSRLAVGHLDVKPDNVLYRGTQPGAAAEVRLGDFGGSQVIAPGQEALPAKEATLPAPEVVRGQAAACASDMWSAAATLGEIFNPDVDNPFWYTKIDLEAFLQLRRSITDARGDVHPSWLKDRTSPLARWLYNFYVGDVELCRYALKHLWAESPAERAPAKAAWAAMAPLLTPAHRTEATRILDAAGAGGDMRALEQSLRRFHAWERVQSAPGRS
jgi:hypothetical protein